MGEPETKEEIKEESKEEEVESKVEDAPEKPAEEEEDEEPPQAELTEEESKVFFTKGGIPDLSEQVLNKTFGDFSIPEKSEVFDEVKFVWQKEKASKEYLHKWVLERKRTCRLDHLQPSEWFQKKQTDFTKKLADWEAK